MSNEILHNTLQHIDSVNYLTFTGGEPSLAPEVIEEAYQMCLWKKIEIEYFYIVTNACPHNRYGRFLRAVDRFSGYCNQKDLCALEISRDQFHSFDPSRYHIFERYMKDVYYEENPPYFLPEGRSKFIDNPIGEGRAAETMVGDAPIKLQEPWMVDEDRVYEGEVYVSANGNVTSCCDMSYARIDRDCKGNVLTTPLPQIIESYCTHTEFEEVVCPSNV
jgi:hypothetical protein